MNPMFRSVTVLFFALVLVSVGVDAAELPANAVAFHAATFQRLQPTVRRWIGDEARNARQTSPDQLENSLRSAISSRFAGQNLADMDIDALIELVMMQCAKDADEDLRAMLEQMNGINDGKKAMRDAEQQLKDEMARTAGRGDAEPCVAPACGVGLRAALNSVASAQRRARVRGPLMRVDFKTVGDLKVVGDDLKAKMGSMNEMGEMQTLKLQMLTDRRSKLMEMLSNIMKKISSTQDAIIGNLK